MESPPPGQPVVVIQYRDRGLPWYAFLLIVLLIPLVAAAVYYRATSRPGAAAGPGPAQTSVAAAKAPSNALESARPGPPVAPAAGPQPTSATGNKAATATAATPVTALGVAPAQPHVPPAFDRFQRIGGASGAQFPATGARCHPASHAVRCSAGRSRSLLRPIRPNRPRKRPK